MLRRGEGCEHCLGTGLAGRTVITELFLPDDRIAELIREGAEVGHLAEVARQNGFRSMTEDGKDKVRLGFTTMDEVLRVSRTTRMTREEREAL